MPVFESLLWGLASALRESRLRREFPSFPWGRGEENEVADERFQVEDDLGEHGLARCLLRARAQGAAAAHQLQAGALKDREAIASALPQGVTLESPVVPDALYGSSSKNVEEALANLQAYVRNNIIYDGGFGREIHFQPEGAKESKSAGKTGKKAKARSTVIVLSKSGR